MFDKKLKIDDFSRQYTDKSYSISIEEPNEEQLTDIYLSLHKVTDESRQINCFACGYRSCKEFARAIYNNSNHKENCIFYTRKELELYLRDIKLVNKSLEEANKHKTKFLSTMSHELRTPLNAIMGYSELLSRCSHGELNDKQTGFVQIINNSSNHLLDLINDILNLAKIDAGTLDMTTEEISPDLFVDYILDMTKVMCNKKIFPKYCSKKSLT